MKCTDRTEAQENYALMADREHDLDVSLWTNHKRDRQMWKRFRRSCGGTLWTN